MNVLIYESLTLRRLPTCNLRVLAFNMFITRHLPPPRTFLRMHK
jgi:hypothetical protein